MVNKKAISPVITTILLILVAIAAVAVVAGFIIPFVQENLRGECFEAIDQIEIDSTSKYTCYYFEDFDGEDYDHFWLNMSVKRGAKPLGIEEFRVTVYGEGRNENFKIWENQGGEPMPSEYAGKVKMLNGSVFMDVPKVGEMKTYSLNTTFKSEITSVEIAPVVKGSTPCDAVDRKNVYPCL